jgi:uncharacterized protein YllA (UPF0747 family)
MVSDIFESTNMRTWVEGCHITQQRNTHKITANEIFHVEQLNLLLQNNNAVLHRQMQMTKLVHVTKI